MSLLQLQESKVTQMEKLVLPDYMYKDIEGNTEVELKRDAEYKKLVAEANEQIIANKFKQASAYESAKRYFE